MGAITNLYFGTHIAVPLHLLASCSSLRPNGSAHSVSRFPGFLTEVNHLFQSEYAILTNSFAHIGQEHTMHAVV